MRPVATVSPVTGVHSEVCLPSAQPQTVPKLLSSTAVAGTDMSADGPGALAGHAKMQSSRPPLLACTVPQVSATAAAMDALSPLLWPAARGSEQAGNLTTDRNQERNRNRAQSWSALRQVESSTVRSSKSPNPHSPV